MAANKFVIELIAIFALSLAATRNVDAYCSIQLYVWNSSNSSFPQPSLVKTFLCTPSPPGGSSLIALSYSWSGCLLNDTDPANACTPVDPAPFDGRNHVAVVPTCKPRQGGDCSLEEKARNLGQANYVAFITWYDCNYSNSFDLQIESSANKSAVPVSVDQHDGLELLSFTNNPNYVVDINIDDYAVSEMFTVTEIIIMLFLSFFGLCSSCCWCYTVFEVRLLEKCCTTPCHYVQDHCFNLYLICCVPAMRCVLIKWRRRVCICLVIAMIVVFGICCGLGLYPWHEIQTPSTLIVFIALAVVGMSICCCWPCILCQCCCKTPYRRHHQPVAHQAGLPVRPTEPIVSDMSVSVSVRPGYTQVDIDRMAVKCTYKMGQGMNETCSICLEEFTEGEQIRELPCLHVYHGGCVEKWLNQFKHTCPLCKTPITARRKKRVAVRKSDRSPLLTSADAEVSFNYGSSISVAEGEEDAALLQLAG